MNPSSNLQREIYVRCHTCILNTNREKRKFARTQPVLPRYALVLDTETTTDDLQSLNLGAYGFCESNDSGEYVCQEEGLFYADDLPASDIKILRKYVASENQRLQRTWMGRKLKLYDRSAFVEKVFYVAVQANATIVAFNLPFDLSRLAVEYRVARVAGGRGWSFVLFRYWDKKKRKWLPNSFRPRIQLRPKDSKAAFIRMAGGDTNQPYRRGRFLDLKTLAWALRNKSFSLESACREFKVPGKLNHVPTGRVTREEIDYCRQDVRASVGLLNALIAEFRQYPLGDLQPERAYSAASIAKAFLATMGLTPPLQKFQRP